MMKVAEARARKYNSPLLLVQIQALVIGRLLISAEMSISFSLGRSYSLTKIGQAPGLSESGGGERRD